MQRRPDTPPANFPEPGSLRAGVRPNGKHFSLNSASVDGGEPTPQNQAPQTHVSGIKLLIWLDNAVGGVVADCAFGDYEITEVGYMDAVQWELTNAVERVGYYDTVQLAKDAAQADYEVRIKSAFNPTPATNVKPEAIEDAAKMLCEWIGTSWDGAGKKDLQGQYSDWAHSSFGGLKLQGGQPALRRIAARMLAIATDPSPQQLSNGSEKDFHRAANALLNTLWQKVYSGHRTHEENWLEMDRQYPQARWLNEELAAARDSAALATEGK